MHPAGRTVSYNRGWFVNNLEEAKREESHGLKVEIAQASNFLPTGRDFHRSWSKDASLIRGDNLVLSAAPGDAATEQRGGEID
jgi:hypothetical protein